MDYGSNGGIARRRDRCSQYVPGSFPVRSQLFTPLVLKAHGCSQCSGRCPPAPYIQFRSEADSTAKTTTGNSGTVGTSLPCNKLAMEQSGNRGGTASFAACKASTLMSAQSPALELTARSPALWNVRWFRDKADADRLAQADFRGVIAQPAHPLSESPTIHSDLRLGTPNDRAFTAKWPIHGLVRKPLRTTSIADGLVAS